MVSEIKNNGSSGAVEDTSARQQKRTEVVSQEEAQLDQIRASYRKRKDEARAWGEASVNHIKEENEQRIQLTKKSADAEFEAHRRVTQSQYDNNRKAQESQNEQLRTARNQGSEQLKKEYEKAQERLQSIQQSENQQTQQIQDTQKKVAKKAQEDGQREILKINDQTKDKTHQLHTASIREEDAIRKQHDEKLKFENDTNRERLRQEEETARNQLKLSTTANQKAMADAREIGNHNLTEVQNRLVEQYKHTQTQGEEHLNKLRANYNTKTVTEERNRAELMTKLQEKYKNEQQRTSKAGEEQLQETAERVDKQMAKQEAELDRAKNEKRAQYQSDLTEARKNFETTRDRENTIYDKNLKKQQSEYQSRHANNQRTNELSLSIQDRLFQKALNTEKLDLTEKVTAYRNYKTDPFYNIKQADAFIRESEKEYLIEVAVPKHEVKNIKVNVDKDRVVITGNRAFEDKVDSGDRTVSSNNFQSFREELKLKKPVLEKNVQHSYEDGVYRVRIPKVGA